jgi:hypothetical protein
VEHDTGSDLQDAYNTISELEEEIEQLQKRIRLLELSLDKEERGYD